MSFLSFFTHGNQEVSLLLDIGSGSVGAALVCFAPKKQPRILYTTRTDIAFQKQTDPKRLPLLLTRALGTLLESVMKDGVKHTRFVRPKRQIIDAVHVVLASPWYISHTTSKLITKELPIVITPEVLDKYILEEQQALIDSLPAREGQFQEGVRPVEHSVVRLLLNGYETSQPYGKRAKELCLTSYVSLMPERIAELIDTAVRSVLYPPSIHFHTFGLAAFTAVRALFPHADNFLFLDVGSEVSELFLVKQGALVDSVSVPCGKHSFVRMVANDMSVEESVALSHIRLHVTHTGDSSTDTRVAHALSEIKEEWLAHLSVALDLFEKTATLPEKVFLTADADILPLLLLYCSSMRSTAAGTHWTPVCTPLTLADTARHVHTSSGTESDIFSAINTLFIRELHQSRNSR
ncbi:MAG: hypothetical protein AAB447_01565 [Patescibacteria group bacterium]